MKAILCFLFLIFLSSCEQPDVTVRRVPKQTLKPHQVSVSWTAPSGWNALGKSNFLIESYKKTVGKKSVLRTVSKFDGDAGGKLANINRWRAQINLPSVQSPNIKHVHFNDLNLDFIELDSGKDRILGGILTTEKDTWFFKLTGDYDLISKEKETFLMFLKSLKL